MDKRRESVKRHEKSENNRRENESPIHNTYCKETSNWQAKLSCVWQEMPDESFCISVYMYG